MIYIGVSIISTLIMYPTSIYAPPLSISFLRMHAAQSVTYDAMTPFWGFSGWEMEWKLFLPTLCSA